MTKNLYTAIVDGHVVATWNHVELAKRDAEFYLQYCNGWSAWILKGNRLYAHRMYDSEWEAISGPDIQLAELRSEYYKELEHYEELEYYEELESR